jgi:hypothetical protein
MASVNPTEVVAQVTAAHAATVAARFFEVGTRQQEQSPHDTAALSWSQRLRRA